MKIQKNPKASEALLDYLKRHAKNNNIQEVLYSVEHEVPIAKLLYAHMPKMIKWSLKEDRFVHFFSGNKQLILSQVSAQFK